MFYSTVIIAAGSLHSKATPLVTPDSNLILHNPNVNSNMTILVSLIIGSSIIEREVLCLLLTYYAVASHYYKELFCENSDVRGFL